MDKESIVHIEITLFMKYIVMPDKVNVIYFTVMIQTLTRSAKWQILLFGRV